MDSVSTYNLCGVNGGKIIVELNGKTFTVPQKIIDRSHAGDVLQHLYASDLGITISLISRDGYFYLGTEGKRISLKAQRSKKL